MEQEKEERDQVTEGIPAGVHSAATARQHDTAISGPELPLIKKIVTHPSRPVLL